MAPPKEFDEGGERVDCHNRSEEHGKKDVETEDPQQDDGGEDPTATTTTNLRQFPLVELTLENVSYAPVTSSASGSRRSEQKRVTVLNRITTKISPYKLTAWMGPSGSGKTSLISVAADLTMAGDIQEESLISVNGEEGRIPKRLVGVVWQDDLLLSNLTVEENIYFAARLKTPEIISDAAVRKVVEKTMEELGLSHIRNSLVGGALGAVRGISGGERKRVAVGAELVVRPSCSFFFGMFVPGLDDLFDSS